MQPGEASTASTGNPRLNHPCSCRRCGPCHAIAPTFEALSRQYNNVNFLKCDVDAARDVAGKYGISAMYDTRLFCYGVNALDQCAVHQANVHLSERIHKGRSSAWRRQKVRISFHHHDIRSLVTVDPRPS